MPNLLLIAIWQQLYAIVWSLLLRSRKVSNWQLRIMKSKKFWFYHSDARLTWSIVSSFGKSWTISKPRTIINLYAEEVTKCRKEQIANSYWRLEEETFRPSKIQDAASVQRSTRWELLGFSHFSRPYFTEWVNIPWRSCRISVFILHGAGNGQVFSVEDVTVLLYPCRRSPGFPYLKLNWSNVPGVLV